MSDPASTGNAAFVQAAADAKVMTYKPNNDELLELYGLFKQSIFGDNETAKPGMFDLQGKAKWDAYTKCKGMSKEAAQAQYIVVVTKLRSKQP
ncbi:hypothetical protein SmJEL517_g01461 [Synchytrium microbalum]|uniref:ACB domain-containing protein n=1 Tax=Synchytrium microbalum TaxID=1806994 RepID=A0A507C5I5_9FUNG|nr:uncharacterized protein SmJEL517_g01461 [Synchytrium microbalum]TPX36257.1 hypothetical protein SmJEL517_g01461 [Synchytrium microbalum]